MPVQGQDRDDGIGRPHFLPLFRLGDARAGMSSCSSVILCRSNSANDQRQRYVALQTALEGLCDERTIGAQMKTAARMDVRVSLPAYLAALQRHLSASGDFRQGLTIYQPATALSHASCRVVGRMTRQLLTPANAARATVASAIGTMTRERRCVARGSVDARRSLFYLAIYTWVVRIAAPFVKAGGRRRCGRLR